MLTDNNRKATILAYYFSKFDRDAMKALGCSTLTEAFGDLSLKLGKDNYYLKLRRDEFDPLTGSHRVGFNKRMPNAVVETFYNSLKHYSFEELTKIVQSILADNEVITIEEHERQQARGNYPRVHRRRIRGNNKRQGQHGSYYQNNKRIQEPRIRP